MASLVLETTFRYWHWKLGCPSKWRHHRMNDPREDARWAMELVMRLAAPAQCVHAIACATANVPPRDPASSTAWDGFVAAVSQGSTGVISGLDRRYCGARNGETHPRFNVALFGRTTNPYIPSSHSDRTQKWVLRLNKRNSTREFADHIG